MILKKRINHGHLFCGLGGGAKGFNRGKAKVGNLQADFRCIGGIDVDTASCRDFRTQTGVDASCMDLFSREQYRDFHGKEPPADWRERTPEDIRRAFMYEHPHILFLSAPCKGFSGLLSERISATRKYQALNGLTLRGIWLALEAFKNDPVELIVFENVPRIATRGRFLLDQIIALLRAYGYAAEETKHDCGELGNLGQSRKRFLLVARHTAKVPPFLYEPIKHPLRGVGEILDRLPVPGSAPGIGGPMHRMPSLQWKTWVRLAFVRAGADWRSLNELRVAEGHLQDFGIVPDRDWHGGVLGVNRWNDSAGTITGHAKATTGAFNVADPREFRDQDFHGLRVNTWDQTAGPITTQRSPGSSAQSVADPRFENWHAGASSSKMRVTDWEETGGTVTGAQQVGSGALSVADPRIEGHDKSVQLSVWEWDQPAGVVTGKMFAGGGPNSVADPRIEGKRFNSTFRIVRWGETSPTVAGPGGPAGGLAVADPRSPGEFAGRGKYKVTAFEEPAGTVIGASTTGQGAFALADPRPGFGKSTHHHVLKVTAWNKPGGTVTSSTHPAGGALSVADPRSTEPRRNGALGVADWEEHAGTVAAESLPSNGKFAVADPRPEALSDPERDAYVTGGHYGVVPWEQPSGAVPAHAKNNNGPWSVADPRDPPASRDAEKWDILPAANDKLICTIRALDGTWHRPFTTLELAALQGLVDPEEDLILDGLSDSAWRERIGNMVPPPAAEAIAGVCGITLLAAWSGQTFMMGSTPIWVRPVAVALMAAREIDSRE